jgi:hypothetical protein
MTIQLSSLQYNMLATFADQPNTFHMTIEEAQKFDQRPFGSMLKREYVVYRPGRGFHITTKGRRAHDDFLTAEISRKNFSAPLTHWFDPTAYGLTLVKAAKGASAA